MDDVVTFRDISQAKRVELAKAGKAIPRKNADGEVVDGSYPIENVSDLENAIQSVGRAAAGEQAQVKAHIRKQARALGAADKIPQSWSEPALRSLYLAEPNVQGGVSAPFEILRVGETKHPNFGKTTITEADLDKAVANFNAWKAKGAEVPVDYDHSFAEGGDSVAAGWIKELVRRGKSLFARVKWTAKAAEQIRSEEYRFISAEFSEDWKDEFGADQGFTVVAAGLTNRPFLKGMSPVALSGRIEAEDVRFLVPAMAPADSYAGNVTAALTVGDATLTSGTWIVPVTYASSGTAAVWDKPDTSVETPGEVADTLTVEIDGEEKEFSVEEISALHQRAADAEAKVAEAGTESKDFTEASERVKTLSEANKSLTERLDSVESELLNERTTRDLDRARREGRIDAAEETTTKWTERYVKLGRETARELLFEMPAETISVTERGSGAGSEFAVAPEGVDPERFDLDRRASALAEEKGISYTEALEKVAG